jgi:hypothetical protein
LRSFRAYFVELGFDLEAVERAAVTGESKFDIHSDESLFFMQTVVGAGAAVLETLKEGLMLDLVRQPSHYWEQNNKSALRHLQVVREKVAEWERGSFVEKLLTLLYVVILSV